MSQGMRFDLIAEYLTLGEVAERWNVSPQSRTIERAILSGNLKPCVWLPATQLQACSLEDDRPAPEYDNGAPRLVDAAGWFYPYAPCKQPMGPFAALFPVLADSPDYPKTGRIFLTANPPSLASLRDDGVVMMSDLRATEARLRSLDDGEAFGAKEERSLLKLVSIMLFDFYRYDAQERRSDVVARLVKTGGEIGLPIADGTARRWARRAQSDFPPKLAQQKSLSRDEKASSCATH